ALRILVDIPAVKLEPVFATVVGKDGLVAIVLWRVEKESFGLDATVNGSIDCCSGFFKAPLLFHDGIGFIKIDSPGADDRKPGRIHLVGCDPVAAEKTDRRCLGQLRPTFS